MKKRFHPFQSGCFAVRSKRKPAEFLVSLGCLGALTSWCRARIVSQEERVLASRTSVWQRPTKEIFSSSSDLTSGGPEAFFFSH